VFDLQIHTESLASLCAELDHVVDYNGKLGFNECELLFGWAWRTIPDKPDLSWRNIRIPTSEIGSAIQQAEAAGLGKFGHDDVWITFNERIPEFQFCHHSGVHLSYFEGCEITKHFQNRWRTLGLNPIEREVSDQR
jgi:hypothetical protein